MTDPIQEQLIAARKNQILDAAALVFAEKGFHPTTIKDIARQAGIADGTIYNYFKNKTALLMGVFERMQTASLPEAAPPPPGEIDSRAFIKTVLAHPLQALKTDNFALFRVVVSEMMVNEELRGLYYERILAPTLMMGEIYFHERGLESADVQIAVRVIAGLMQGLMMSHIMGDPVLAEKWDDLPDILADVLLDGLLGEE
jgi:AcrR family transcriptional regulator